MLKNEGNLLEIYDLKLYFYQGKETERAVFLIAVLKNHYHLAIILFLILNISKMQQVT